MTDSMSGNKSSALTKSFGFGDVPSGTDVTHIVKTLEVVRRNPATLPAIEEATTSCLQWGGIMQKLLKDVQPLFVRSFYSSIRLEDYERIAEELRKGYAVLVSLKFPGSTNHVFTIEARRNGTARILHAWQGKHQLRAERTMPVDEMVGYLKRLPELDWVTDKLELQNIRHQLWGADHAEVPDIGTSPRRRISYEMLIKGKPDRPLASSVNRERLTILCCELSEWQYSMLIGAGVGAGLGFVFGAGGVLLVGLIKRERVDYVEVGLAGLKSALGGGLGCGAGAAVAKVATPTFARIGVSVVRSNAVAGVTMFGVFAIWDVVEWKMDKITEVQLRKRLAEEAGGAAGGIGGAALGVVGGVSFGPIGALAGALVGGIAGGIGGAFAGREIDGAIWDESEDAVMNSYEYFGWRGVKRNTRPTKSADEIGKAYDRKLGEKPENVEEEDWHKFCLGNLMVLLSAMYPEFKKMIQLADELQKKKSSGLSAIGTAFYEYLSSE